MFGPSPHRRDCEAKQLQLKQQIDALPLVYTQPCTEEDNKILDLSLTDLVQRHGSGTLSTASIMQAYGKKALAAQKKTSCLAAIMIQDIIHTNGAPQHPSTPLADGLENGCSASSTSRHKTPLLSGIPVSIKDCIDVAGYDTTIGYSSRVGHPLPTSAAIVRLLHDAGALTHVKTTVPPGLISLETASDLFGRTSNPYNTAFGSGASTGGGGALLAQRGSMIEIGTDVGGSVRLPAHWCGVYCLKSSAGRFPAWGAHPPLPGMEGVPTTCSPLARRLEDLDEFCKRVIAMRPWEYDHSCIPLPWQPADLGGSKLRWGVIWEDGIIPPTPACRRALEWTVDALRKQGHEVIDFTPPPIAEGFMVGLQLCFSDGGEDFFRAVRNDETLDKVMMATKSLLAMPLWIKRILAAMTSDPFQAKMLTAVHVKTPREERLLVVQREEYRARWHEAWERESLDFVLTVPHPTPAIPAGAAEKVTLGSCSYAMLFNVLDYVTGVLPVTNVDPSTDLLPPMAERDEYMNMGTLAKGAHSVYDADKMAGLPVGVQVVGQQLREERVLAGMKVVEDALNALGRRFVPSEF